MPLIEIENLSFGYNHDKIIDALSWQIEAGDFWYLKGINGAGKSTLLKIVAGLLGFSEGQISYECNHPPAYYNPEIGCYNDLTVKQNIEIFSSLTVQEQQLKDKLYDLLHIPELNSKCFRHLSHGQRFRVLLYRTLSQKAEIYLFDEPVEGLDTFYLSKLGDIFGILKDLGKTVILVSHILPDKWAPLFAKKALLETGCLYCNEQASVNN